MRKKEEKKTFPLDCEINENIIKTFMGCFRETTRIKKIIN